MWWLERPFSSAYWWWWISKYFRKLLKTAKRYREWNNTKRLEKVGDPDGGESSGFQENWNTQLLGERTRAGNIQSIKIDKTVT